MLISAIVLFVLAAVFGLVALTAILKNKPTPKPAVFIHGGLAAIALVLVILYAVTGSGAAPVTRLVLVVVAALGGFVLFAKDMQHKSIPTFLAIAHPIIAAVGLVLLILFVVSN